MLVCDHDSLCLPDKTTSCIFKWQGGHESIPVQKIFILVILSRVNLPVIPRILNGRSFPSAAESLLLSLISACTCEQLSARALTNGTRRLLLLSNDSQVLEVVAEHEEERQPVP